MSQGGEARDETSPQKMQEVKFLMELHYGSPRSIRLVLGPHHKESLTHVSQ